MPTQDELFAAVDALLAGAKPGLQLPEPAERARLREAAGVTQAQLAKALQTTTQTVKNYENGRSQPKPPRLEAYVRLLEGWAAKYPAPDTAPAASTVDQVPAAFAPAPAPATPVEAAPDPTADAVEEAAKVAPQAPAVPAARPAAARPGGQPLRRAARPAPYFDGQFPNGPLAVLDGDGVAYGVGGLILECPATTLAQLVTWALAESGLGTARLHRNGKDGDPLIVLTAAAAAKFGLPATLDDDSATRRSQRLPEDHKVVKALARSKWQLTRRGFGPWARIYKPVKDGRRQCVQLAVLPWRALDTRAWGDAADLPAPDLARVLGVYAQRVITPRGSTATCGLELMTALRPPTRAVRDEATGGWVSGPNPGALTEVVEAAPPEVPPEHPAAQDWDGGFLDEESYQWIRPVETLSEAEMIEPFAVGIDINTAYLAAAARLSVGLSGPVHIQRPTFDKKAPGSWFVDLSGIPTDPRLPSPFTPTGKPPTGPAWYATPTVAYAVELGYDVQPIEAYLREKAGAYLDPWHDRLREAYVTTMAEAGIPVEKDADERQFLAAMTAHRLLKSAGADLDALRQALAAEGLGHLAAMGDDQLAAAAWRHHQIAMVLSAVKSTVKFGIGKLRERPQGVSYKKGEPWPALERETWRPDIRAAVIAKARVNMHRKMANVAKANGRYPLGVNNDCVVYASPGACPLDFLPLTGSGKGVLPGTFRLGATPGLAKVEGVQQMLTVVDWLERDQPVNPARHIKGYDSNDVDGK
ncbi:helix-turn-helix transcriptional regulator [Streptomyces sp. SP17BM10]|uniref:telomere-associated protein Tap n=1 Tax=Streptomyces sp. SP17BM10 TaxID=3002530 RepID=UPI002E787566|nr:helix-turn-helix transcriptional regulator [Streptomyces sp. SP17BM10]MEE1782675.1 helix-turn-helix transcriptional regulator [Streptomyces sp. SP17BM10]